MLEIGLSRLAGSREVLEIVKHESNATPSSRCFDWRASPSEHWQVA